MSIRKTWAFPCAGEKRKEKKKEVLRLSLHHHEFKSSPPCKQHADPAQTAWVLFCVVTALNEKNAGEPNFPPPFVSPLPKPSSHRLLWLWENYTHVHKFSYFPVILLSVPSVCRSYKLIILTFFFQLEDVREQIRKSLFWRCHWFFIFFCCCCCLSLRKWVAELGS